MDGSQNSCNLDDQWRPRPRINTSVQHSSNLPKCAISRAPSISNYPERVLHLVGVAGARAEI